MKWCLLSVSTMPVKVLCQHVVCEEGHCPSPPPLLPDACMPCCGEGGGGGGACSCRQAGGRWRVQQVCGGSKCVQAQHAVRAGKQGMHRQGGGGRQARQGGNEPGLNTMPNHAMVTVPHHHQPILPGTCTHAMARQKQGKAENRG